MVSSCSVKKCTEKSVRGSNVSFHRFPQDITMRKRWLAAIGRENFNPSINAKVCSKHFDENCYNTSGWSSVKTLKKDAIPNSCSMSTQSIVGSPKLLNIVEDIPPQQRSCPNNDNKISTIAVDMLPQVPSNKSRITSTTLGTEKSPSRVTIPPKKRRYKRKSYIGDFCNDVLKTAEVCAYRKAVEVILSRKNILIHTLKQRNHRLKQKMGRLHSLANLLKDKDTISETAKYLLAELTKARGTSAYSKELKCSVQTLNIYSPRYSNVRHTFSDMLPHSMNEC